MKATSSAACKLLLSLDLFPQFFINSIQHSGDQLECSYKSNSKPLNFLYWYRCQLNKHQDSEGDPSEKVGEIARYREIEIL